MLLELVALVGGTVHTMEPGAEARVATILVEDGRIRAVGPEIDVPDEAERIDCAGLHLVPGLIDGWAHHDADHDRLYVAHGVTLIRDAGNDLGRILGEREPFARERGPGPALLICGAVLDGAPPATTSAVVLASVAEVQPKLERLASLGIDFLATHVGLTPEVWRAVIGFGREHELDVWGPRPRALVLAAALDPPPSGLVAIDALLPEGERWETVATDTLRPGLEAFSASGAALVPLLSVHAVRVVAPQPKAPDLVWLGALYQRLWIADFEARRAAFDEGPEAYVRAGLEAVRAQGELLSALARRGVRLVPGSGSPHPWLLPGRALIDELSLWRRAGLDSAEVLRLATAGAAETLGVGAERGTLTPGKVADVVGYSADPTRDIAALKQPELVVLRGRVLRRADLDELLSDLAAEQARLREEAALPIEVAALELPEGEVLLTGKVESWLGPDRLSAERFGVVRERDGTLAYVGRLRRPASASTEGSELVIEQRLVQNRLLGFRVRVESGERVLEVVGQTAGGRMSVERRVDGSFVDNVPLLEEIALVDAGSVTAALILGHHVEPGLFRALYFEDADPALSNYELRLDEERSHLVRGPGGDRIVRFDERGFPVQSLERTGTSVVETRALEIDTHDGIGLPLPANKRPPSAPAPAPASAPAGREPPDEGGGGR